jgi:hypothetical protein
MLHAQKMSRKSEVILHKTDACLALTESDYSHSYCQKLCIRNWLSSVDCQRENQHHITDVSHSLR